MARPRLKVVLIAEEAAGVRALRLLADRGQPPAAVLTRTDAVAAQIEELDLPRLEVGLIEDPDLAEWIERHEVDLLLNVHSIVNPHERVLAAPRIGSFNMHPGPLPRFAGFNGPSWAIVAGEERHAVTVHWMVAEMDAGPIAYEEWFEIGPRDTGLRVASKGVAAGLPLLERLLDDAERGAIPSRPQAAGGHFYWFEVPYGGRLPWRQGAKLVVDLVRAADYAPYPSPWGTFATRVGGAEVEVVRAALSGEAADVPPGTIGEPSGEVARVAAGDEWVLVERARLDGEPVAPAVALPAGARCELPASDGPAP